MNRLLKWLRQVGTWIRPFFASLPQVAALNSPSPDLPIRKKIARAGDRRFATRRNPTVSAGDADLRDAPNDG